MKRILIALILCCVLLAIGFWQGGKRHPERGNWGVDSVLAHHVSSSEFHLYLSLIRPSGVGMLRERSVGKIGGTLTNRREWIGSPKTTFTEQKVKGFQITAFASLPFAVRKPQSGNQLPEDLMHVFRQAQFLGQEFSGLVDAWEMVGEPDVGYCHDLADRVAAYQKALYLGLKAQPPAKRVPIVVMGALALPPGPWFKRADRNGILQYTDGYNFHFYGHASDFGGVIAAHESVASRGFDEGDRLPLWITECGIAAVRSDDFLNPVRRQLQADFTVHTAREALAHERVTMFMPFILAHQGDPHAMTLSAAEPLPAWTAYAEFTRSNPWPERPLANVPNAPNPVVVQWLPDNATTRPHKVSGSYRFLGTSPIEGVVRIYNFSDKVVRGRLAASPLVAASVAGLAGETLTIQPMDSVAVPLIFRRQRETGYFREDCLITFTEADGRASQAFFALESIPSAADFEQQPLRISPTMQSGAKHRFGPEDTVTNESGSWQGLNDIHVEDLNAANLSPGDDADSIRLRLRATSSVRDPLRARLAVAAIAPLPAQGFLCVQLDRPMGRDFAFCVDLLDRDGQRFTIWENFGVSYFEQHSTEYWLNLADFHIYFWGRCTADPTFHPERIEEIQLRTYNLSPQDRPREITISLMVPRSVEGRTGD